MINKNPLINKLTKHLFGFILSLCIFLFVFCEPKVEVSSRNPDKIAIRVAKHEIEWKKIANESAECQAKTDPDFLRKKLIAEAANNLMAEKARKIDPEKSGKFAATFEIARNRILKKLLFENECGRIQISESEIRTCLNRADEELSILHIQIPASRRDIFDEVKNHFELGNSFDEIFGMWQETMTNWIANGLQLLTQHVQAGMLDEKLEKAVWALEPGEWDFFEYESGFHIIKLEKRWPREFHDYAHEKEAIRQRIVERKIREAGGSWLVRYKNDNNLMINENLLNSISFSPFGDSEIVYQVGNQKGALSDLLYEIKKLPADVQLLFLEPETRLKAVKSLIFMNHGYEPQFSFKEIQSVERLIQKVLQDDFERNGLGNSQLFPMELWERQIKILQTWLDENCVYEKNRSFSQMLVEAARQWSISDLTEMDDPRRWTFPWIYPEIYAAPANLLLDTQAILEMSLPHPYENTVIARKGKWKLTAGQFLEQWPTYSATTIGKLHTQSGKIQLIEYLAGHRNVSQIIKHQFLKPTNFKTLNLEIDSILVKKLNPVSQKIEQNPFQTESKIDTNEIVARLGAISFSVGKLRAKVAKLPLSERLKFENKKTRYSALIEFIENEAVLIEAQKRQLDQTLEFKGLFETEKTREFAKKYFNSAISENSIPSLSKTNAEMLRAVQTNYYAEKFKMKLDTLIQEFEVFIDDSLLVECGLEKLDFSGNDLLTLLAEFYYQPLFCEHIGEVFFAKQPFQSGSVTALSASGHDIWSVQDAFQFLHQPVTGDFEMIVRVLKNKETDVNSKAGLMIRESLAPDSKHASIYYSGHGEVAYHYREANGGATTASKGNILRQPYLKILRKGNEFHFFRSPDGYIWEFLDIVTVEMNQKVNAGMIVCSHQDYIIGDAVFSDFRIIK